MARVTNQDRVAFAVLVDRHLDAIHAFHYRLTHNAEDAADLAQETFLRVWNKAATWKPNRVKFTTWVHRIAHNLCVDFHRRRRDTEDVDVDTLEGAGPTLEQAPANEALRTALNGALGRLPERQRTALLLCHRQNMSNREAADVLEISVDALESLLSRARRSLRATLREYR